MFVCHTDTCYDFNSDFTHGRTIIRKELSMKQLILVGAGKAHLFIIKQLIKQPLEDVEILLISPSSYQYFSGMFSGFIEGLYPLDGIRIDVQKLSKQANIQWKKQAVVSIDPVQKMILTDQGEVLNFDAISFNIGSLTADTDLTGVKKHARRIKPNYHFPEMIAAMQQSQNPVIYGGGMDATEIALSLQARKERNKEGTPVSLITHSSRLLEDNDPKVSAKVHSLMEQKGMRLYLSHNVREMNSTKIITDQGKIPFQDTLWLAGPRAPELFKLSKLPTDQQGYLQVESTLQVKQYPAIFGAGNCISLSHPPFPPKDSVFAGKEALTLWGNIKGFLTDGTGQHLSVKNNNLSIMSIGHKEALLFYGLKVWKSKWAWKLKDKMDRKWIDSYKNHN